jgi:2,4-dienoyl-CoA reductase-like NADH-dependent reductase (Old Yellow Enzyme family)/NADPH-dependent 2,4-dienoyl-CoA reductase/sulfur reductase-like enzyme
MAYEYLLREGRINSMTVRNRLIAGPMERAMANRDGSMRDTYIQYLTERARGGAGLIYVESTYVDTRGMGRLHQVGCHGDHVIPGLRRMAQAVHAEGAKVALELYMGGRETPSYTSQRQPIAPSVVVCKGLNPIPTPREMTRADIEEVIAKFAEAARRVAEAGLDMIVLHGAHGYLLDAFLSPYSNKRTDEWGGTLENRARFPLAVLAAVRKVVGASFPISYRLSSDEYVEGGLHITDTARFAKMLADNAIDMIDVSGGVYESFEMIIQGPEAPKGGFVRNAKAIKESVGPKVPVSVAQRLNDPAFANEVLRREGLDFISLTRAFHADPHFARKVAENRVDDIIPCIACHYCTNLLVAELPTRCAVNPQTGYERERRIRPALKPRKVAVVGGGPAGMQAARFLALQGNQVVLFEKNGELGGQMRYSSRVATDYGYLVRYLSGQMNKLKVDVHLNTAADLNTIDSVSPEAVIIATGARAGLRFCPWKGNPRTFDLFSALDRPEDQWEERVVIIGGDSESCFLALYLAGHGAEVHVVEPKAVFSEDKMSPGRDLLMMALEKLPTVSLRGESTVEEVGEGYAIIQKHGEFERLADVGSVVVGGRTADNALYEEILEKHPHLEVYNIGDSVVPRDVYYASHEAAEIAELIRLRETDKATLPGAQTTGR